MPILNDYLSDFNVFLFKNVQIFDLQYRNYLKLPRNVCLIASCSMAFFAYALQKTNVLVISVKKQFLAILFQNMQEPK